MVNTIGSTQVIVWGEGQSSVWMLLAFASQLQFWNLKWQLLSFMLTRWEKAWAKPIAKNVHGVSTTWPHTLLCTPFEFEDHITNKASSMLFPMVWLDITKVTPRGLRCIFYIVWHSYWCAMLTRAASETHSTTISVVPCQPLVVIEWLQDHLRGLVINSVGQTKSFVQCRIIQTNMFDQTHKTLHGSYWNIVQCNNHTKTKLVPHPRNYYATLTEIPGVGWDPLLCSRSQDQSSRADDE